VRLVLDTDTVISGLLWSGVPRRILDAAGENLVTLFTSPALLAELEDVLQRPKFVQRLATANVAARELVIGFSALADVIQSAAISPAVLSDPDDDEVLACAICGKVDRIVSGDTHLLELGFYDGIPIVTAAHIIAEIFSE
jgi:putative PIN family toxin of toxin-antitoxin system